MIAHASLFYYSYDYAVNCFLPFLLINSKPPESSLTLDDFHILGFSIYCKIIGIGIINAGKVQLFVSYSYLNKNAIIPIPRHGIGIINAGTESYQVAPDLLKI